MLTKIYSLCSVRFIFTKLFLIAKYQYSVDAFETIDKAGVKAGVVGAETSETIDKAGVAGVWVSGWLNIWRLALFMEEERLTLPFSLKMP